MQNAEKTVNNHNVIQMHKPDRARIDRLVSIWLDVYLDVAQDAGRQGDSLLAKIMEYGGYIESSPKDQSNVAMMLAIKLIREPSIEYYKINPIIRTWLKRRPEYVLPLLARGFYLGLDPQTNKSWTDEGRARKINQTRKKFENNLINGYRTVAQELEITEQLIADCRFMQPTVNKILDY